MPPTDATPEHSQGYGPAEHADDTRQAQHSVSNDAPTDVNFNAVVARAQAEQVNIGGKNYEAGADRRRSMFDIIAAREAGRPTP